MSRPFHISRSSIEPLESRIAPAVIITNNAGALSIVSDGAGDTIAFYAKSGDAMMLVVDVDNNGSAELTVDKTTLTSITVTGAGGADTVLIDLKNGNPGPLVAGAYTFAFDGGGDAGDKLVITDSLATVTPNSATATWRPSSATSAAGSIDLGTGSYGYTTLSAGLDVSKISALSLITDAGIDTFTLTNGVLSGTAGAASHALVFSQLPTLTIDVGSKDGATATADTVTIASLTGSGLKNLTVSTGSGSDRLNINTPSLVLPQTGGTFTFDGGNGDDTIAHTTGENLTLTDASLASSAGGTVSLTGVENALLTGGSGINVFNVSSWHGVATLDGAAGDDTFNVTFNGVAGSVQIAGGSETDTVNLIGTGSNDSFTITGGSVALGAESVTFGTVEMVNLDALGGTDTVTLMNGAVNDQIVVTADNTVTAAGILFKNIEAFDAGAGSDTVTLMTGTTDETILVTGDNAATVHGIAFTGIEALDAGAGNDTVVLTTGALDETINVTGDQAATAHLIAFTGIEALDAGAGNDTVVLMTGTTDETINVTGNNAATAHLIAFTNIEALDAGAGNDTVVLTTGATDETISVTGDNAATAHLIAFTNIEALDAGAGNDTVVLMTGTTDETINVTGDNAATARLIAFTNIEALDAGAGNDTVVLTTGALDETINVTGDNAATAHLIAFTNIEALDAGTGNDSVVLTTGATDETINVTGDNAATAHLIAFTNIEALDAGAGNDTVVLTTGATDETINVTGDNAATAHLIAFTNIEKLDAGAGSDTVQLPATNDTFTITGTNAGSGLGIAFTNIEAVDGGGGIDTLINDSGVKFASVSHSVAGITVSSFETINTPGLLLTSGDDDFTVSAFGDATFGGQSYTGLTCVDALGGQDTIRATADADFVLSDTLLQVDLVTPLPHHYELMLVSFENAVLTGGSSKNTFTINGWSGTGTFNGLGEDDFFNILAWTNTGTINGGDGDDLADVSGWKANGTYNGDADSNTVQAKNDADFELADGPTSPLAGATLKRSFPGPILITTALNGVKTAKLTAEGAANSFTISKWTGLGSLTGVAGGSNSIFAEKDTNFVVSDTQIATSVVGSVIAQPKVKFRGQNHPVPSKVTYLQSGLNLALANIAKVTLIGGASQNYLDAGQFTGTVKLVGMGNTDVLIAGKGDSQLYGFDESSAERDPGAATKIKRNADHDHFYVRDNPGIDVLAQIYATNRSGNVIHFRESSVAVNYTLPTAPKVKKGVSKPLLPDAVVADARVNTSGSGKLGVSLLRGRLQHLEGSQFDDTLKGNNLLNSAWGGAGRDTFTPVGADFFFGGDDGVSDVYNGFFKFYFADGALSDPLLTDGSRDRPFFVADAAKGRKTVYTEPFLKYYAPNAGTPQVDGSGEPVFELRQSVLPPVVST